MSRPISPAMLARIYAEPLSSGDANDTAARRSTVSHTVMPWRCREGGQATPQGRKLHAATLTGSGDAARARLRREQISTIRGLAIGGMISVLVVVLLAGACGVTP